MYIKPDKHNEQKTNSKYFYLILAALAAVFVVVLIIGLPSFLSSSDQPPVQQSDIDHQTKPPVTIQTPDTSDTSDVADTSTEPPQTDPLPFDTGTETMPPETAPETEPETEDETETETLYVPPIVTPGGAVLTETVDAGQSYIDKIVFIGDSTTYSLLYYGVLSGGRETKQVWTPASGTLTLDSAPTTTIVYRDTGEEITIKEAVSRKKPEIVVITLGVNGISYMYNQQDYFISVYVKLIRQIQEASPDTKIILQSIFPVATNWDKPSINNERINLANSWVRLVAEETGVAYLDTISVLAIADGGYLPQNYQNGDGLHLSEEALQVVLRYIRTHALPGYADPVS